LLHGLKETALAEQLLRDIASVSPETKVVLRPIRFEDPGLRAGVRSLFSFARDYLRTRSRRLPDSHHDGHARRSNLPLSPHESHHLPGRLLQSSLTAAGGPGNIKIIDLDLSKYDRIASRFTKSRWPGCHFLKAASKHGSLFI